MQKAFVMSSLFAATLLLGGCHSTDTASTTAPTTTITPLTSVTPISSQVAMMRTVTDTRTVENKDGSTTVVTMYSDGSKSEVRTFKNGRLAKVTRETPATGARTARVTYRDDSADIDIHDESWVEKAMDATGDALATAARKTKAGVKVGVNETADKAEDVGDAIKKGTKKAASETADKAEDMGDAVKKGAKKVGGKIKDAVTPDKKEKPNN